jgi:hypothetical protein
MTAAPGEIMRPQEASPMEKQLRVLGIDMARPMFHELCQLIAYQHDCLAYRYTIALIAALTLWKSGLADDV